VLAEQLRRVRSLLGLTQAEAAERLCVHAVTLARWETGATQPRGLARKYVEEWLCRIEGEHGTGGDDATRTS
jgi:DNA-binding transcriptional regulator YiaG